VLVLAANLLARQGYNITFGLALHMDLLMEDLVRELVDMVVCRGWLENVILSLWSAIN